MSIMHTPGRRVNNILNLYQDSRGIFHLVEGGRDHAKCNLWVGVMTWFARAHDGHGFPTCIVCMAVP